MCVCVCARAVGPFVESAPRRSSVSGTRFRFRLSSIAPGVSRASRSLSVPSTRLHQPRPQAPSYNAYTYTCSRQSLNVHHETWPAPPPVPSPWNQGAVGQPATPMIPLNTRSYSLCLLTHSFPASNPFQPCAPRRSPLPHRHSRFSFLFFSSPPSK